MKIFFWSLLPNSRKKFTCAPQIFFLPPRPPSRSGARPPTPIPPFLTKPSSNSPMLGKRRLKKALQRSKTHSTRFSNSLPISRNTLTPTIIALMKTWYERWSRGHKARGQGHKKNPRPRTKDTDASDSKWYHRTSSRTPSLHDPYYNILWLAWHQAIHARRAHSVWVQAMLSCIQWWTPFFYKEPYCESDV